ncbi:MAG: RlmF-related methyltransferase, partial [Gilliamella sp.]|nr:RlmF-related methyltransferase [Gilliamella sp.]
MQTPLKKPQLHCRNKHRNGYDFAKLIKILPELSRYVNQNSYGNLSIDFADPMAVKLLNKALLFNDYQM